VIAICQLFDFAQRCFQALRQHAVRHQRARGFFLAICGGKGISEKDQEQRVDRYQVDRHENAPIVAIRRVEKHQCRSN